MHYDKRKQQQGKSLAEATMTIPASAAPPWLSDEELRDLTGYVRPTCQARWLAENRIKFYLNALNKVRVPRDAVGTLQSAKAEKRTEPDFTKVRKAS